MKIILLKDVPSAGRKYDVKDVSDGYARNFLLPRGLAKVADDAALKALAEKKAREEERRAKEAAEYHTLSEKLEKTTLTFAVKAGEGGKAFGSVTAAQIRDALKKQKITVEKEWITLAESIKTTGEHSVKIQLPYGIAGEVKVVVESE